MSIYVYRAELDRVVDGDTIDMQIDLGFYTHRHVRIRLLDVDTHEIYGTPKESEEYKRGMEEKRFVEDWFVEAEDLTVETYNDSRGKYGRWLGEIRRADGECLNDRLVEEFDDVEVNHGAQ